MAKPQRVPGPMPRGKPAGVTWRAPLGRTSEPARAGWMPPPTRKSEEEELVGMRKSAPPAKGRERPPPPSPQGPESRGTRQWSRRQGRQRWETPASRSPRGSRTRVLPQQWRLRRRWGMQSRWGSCRRAAMSTRTRGTSSLLLRQRRRPGLRVRRGFRGDPRHGDVRGARRPGA